VYEKGMLTVNLIPRTPPVEVQTPPLAQPEEESDEEVVEEEAGAAAAAFEPTAPPATLTQEKKTGTLQLGKLLHFKIYNFSMTSRCCQKLGLSIYHYSYCCYQQ
jgi:hypothetical protein